MLIRQRGLKATILAFYYNPVTKTTDELVLGEVTTNGYYIDEYSFEPRILPRTILNKNKHKDYTHYSPLGMEFIEYWNKQDRDGAQEKVAKQFKLSIPTVYRIRKKLGLSDLHTLKHPGKHALYKRVKKLYYEHQSTQRVGIIVGLSSQRVNQILREQRVEIGPAHIVNVLHKAPSNGMSASEFVKNLRDLHYEGHTVKSMSVLLKVDQGTISKRMRILGLPLRQNHRAVPGGYSCLWCGKVMETIWVSRGPRRQKFCSNSCKNKVKDYRRYVFGEDRIKIFEAHLKKVWGKDYVNKRKEILGERMEENK